LNRLFFLLFPVFVFSQELSEKQKLLQSIDTASVVSEKVQLYADLAWEYIITENDSALFYAEKAFQFSTKNKYPLGKAIALETKGLYEEIVTGNYDLASTYYFDGIAICEANNLAYATSIYHSLGVMFHTSDNYEKGLKYYRIAYNRALEEEDLILQKKCLINMGAINSSLQNYAKAQALLVESLTLNVRQELDYSTYANLGNLKIRQEKFEEAIPYLLKATEQNLDNVDSEENLMYLIKAKVALKDSIGLKPIIDRAIIHVNKISALRLKSNMTMSLYNYYKAFGDFETALKYQDDYLEMYIKIKERQRDETVYNLEATYQTEKTQRELEKKQAAQKLLFIILGATAVLLFFVSFFLYKNKKKNNLLNKQKRILETTVSEKEVLLKEIHHRVKNNLQVVSSLLSLQQRQINDPLAQQAIQESRNRVKAMSLIHQNLYQDKNLVGVETNVYINKLVNSLVTNYKIEKKHIEINNEIDAITLDIDTIIPLGLIINELISNALKYAFKGVDSALLTISLKLIDEVLVLRVSDNGIGLPHDFSIDNTTSLGYRLIKAFSQKLNATLKIEQLNKGTETRLDILNFNTV